MTEPTLDDTSFDFWVGKWTTRWKDVGRRSHNGTNVVLKLDGSIRELFEGPARPRRYVGASVSEWNLGSLVWEQEYWDNTGYHGFFRGGWIGDRLILIQVRSGGSHEALRRLVWHSVEVDRKLWDYELSEDGGRTWASTWHIAYRRTD
ncbi:MAG TPA: hypothetical protein VGS16_02935 [Candidatus Dormibacteraeota bacterium]|nr:hypothetical protein [Candidatus Dormibacteraeota bacterium]